MTLIAFATYGDRAELICDTAAYSPYYRRFTHSNKIKALPHMDALMATQGNSLFGVEADYALSTQTAHATFDGVVQSAPEWLNLCWQHTGKEREGVEGSAFLLGYSTSTERFVAYRFLAERDFTAEIVEGAHIMPTPLDYQLSDFEADRLRDDSTDLDQLISEWSALPPLEPPTSREEWKEVAIRARDTRALHPYLQVRTSVAGKLLWTRVARGRVRTEVIHEFNDTGEELDAFVAGTLHPRAQIAPCACGSGKRALDCHLAANADGRCPCASGDNLGDCCMLSPEEAEVAKGMGLFTPA